MSGRILVALEETVTRQVLAERIGDTADLIAMQPLDGGPPPDVVVQEVGSEPNGNRHSCPVIYLGDRPREVDSGTYVTLPVHISELIARIRSVLRASKDEAKRFRIGPAVFDVEQAQLCGQNGAVRSLTGMEVETLAYLCRANGRSVPRDELLEMVWGYVPGVETHTVETHLWRLRSSLREIGAGEPLITEDGAYHLDPGAERI